MPFVAIQTRCELIRLSSLMSIRIQIARSGTVTPTRVSTAIENASSFVIGLR